jgi:hypothetical protein
MAGIVVLPEEQSVRMLVSLLLIWQLAAVAYPPLPLAVLIQLLTHSC